MLSACGIPVPVVLAAHSMGFLEALHWAFKYPEEVSALVGLDPAVPEVYQHMDLEAILSRLEALNRSGWKRTLLFWLLAPALLGRCPAAERRRLMVDARRNFASAVWVNEARDLPRSGPAGGAGRASPLPSHPVSPLQRKGHSSGRRFLACVRTALPLRPSGLIPADL